MKRLALVLALLLLPSSASAAACCIGSVGATGARLGPCEYLRMGGSYSIEGLAGSWRRDGTLHPTSASSRIDQRLTVDGRFRLDDRFQLGFSMPLVVSARTVLDTSEVGIGPGDLTIVARLEPADEPTGRAPQPAFGLELILPTGVPVHAAQGTTGAWATGGGHVALAPSLWLGRTFGRGSIEFDTSAGFSMPSPADAGRAVPGVTLRATVLGGIFLQRSATLALSLGVNGRTPGWLAGKAAGSASVAPRVGVGVSFRAFKTAQLSVSVVGSLPIPHLGVSSEATLGAAVGISWIRRQPWPQVVSRLIEAPEES
jgi:hypothetical protein